MTAYSSNEIVDIILGEAGQNYYRTDWSGR